MKISAIALLILLILSGCSLDSENETNKQVDKRQYFSELRKSIDNHFFDYNFVSVSNFAIEEKFNRNRNNDLKSYISGPNYSPFVEDVRDFFRNNYSTRKSVEKKLGFPMWDNLIEYNLNGAQLVIIPLANEESTFTEAIMYAYQSNDSPKIKFHFAVRNKFNMYSDKKDKKDKKPDKEFIISQFVFFDKSIFGYNDCELLGQLKELETNKSYLKTITCDYTVYWDQVDWYSAIIENGELINVTYMYSIISFEYEIWCFEIGGGGGGIPDGGGGSDGGETYEEENPGSEDDSYPEDQGSPDEIPCVGDPVLSPQIAPTEAGILGGTYGLTRVDSLGNDVWHNGIDILGNVGDPLFAMYDGIITKVEPIDNSVNGKYIRMESNVNGELIQITMIHMNEVCVAEGDPVFQGQIIGEIGRTGNAKNVPYSHAHITIRNRRDVGGNWIWTSDTDPACYMSTFFDPINNWAPIPCNN